MKLQAKRFEPLCKYLNIFISLENYPKHFTVGYNVSGNNICKACMMSLTKANSYAFISTYYMVAWSYWASLCYFHRVILRSGQHYLYKYTKDMFCLDQVSCLLLFTQRSASKTNQLINELCHCLRCHVFKN